jgi:hypothetical protein
LSGFRVRGSQYSGKRLLAARRLLPGDCQRAGLAQAPHAVAGEESAQAPLRQLHADGVREVVIPSVAAGAYLHSYVFNADVHAEPDFCVNRAVAAYYGLGTVRAVAGN